MPDRKTPWPKKGMLLQSTLLVGRLGSYHLPRVMHFPEKGLLLERLARPVGVLASAWYICVRVCGK